MKVPMKIFQEPPPNLDETWTHGAVLGGMCGFSDQNIADSYFLAGDTLVAALLSGNERGQDLVNPIMFLYRHGIELYLKVIVQPVDRNHSLGSLLEGFCKHVREQYQQKVPVWLTRPITELATFDPGSDLFRYEKTFPPKYSQRIQNGGEFWIDLKAISETMKHIRKAFRRVIIADATGEIPPSYMA